MYPTKSQEQKLLGVVGSCRYVWNYFLDQEKQRYQSDKTFRFFNKNSKELTDLKRNCDWLRNSPATALQQSIRYLDQALKQSFKSNKNRKGFPKFKSKNTGQVVLL
jgi:putative transposase